MFTNLSFIVIYLFICTVIQDFFITHSVQGNDETSLMESE